MAEQVRFDIVVNDLGSKTLKIFSKNVKTHVGSAMRSFDKLEKVIGRSDVKAKGLSRTMRTLSTSSTNRLAQNFGRANNQLGSMVNNASRLRRIVNSTRMNGMMGGGRGGAGMGMGMLGTYLAPAAVIAGFTAMVKRGAELQSQLVDIRAILSTTDGFTGSGFDQMTEKMKQLGADTIFTTKDVYGATKYMAMAGLNIEQIEKSMKSVTSIAAISGMGLDRAADIITNIQTSYGIAASNMGNVADVLTRTMTSANVNMEELGQSFSYAGGTAARYGIEFKELSAAVGVLGNAGIKASRAGTNLRQMMIRMAAPVKAAQDVLNKYNYSFKETVDGKQRLKSLSTIVKEVNAMKMSADDMKKVFGVYGGEAFGALSSIKDEKGGMMLDAVLERNKNAAGIADKMAEQKMKTFNGTLAKLAAQFELFSDKLFLNVAPAITQVMNLMVRGFKWLNQEGNPVMQALTTAFNVTANVLTWLYHTVKENATALKWLAGTALAVYAAFKLFAIVGTIVTLVRNLKFAWAGLNAVMAANPIGAVIVALVALAAGFIYLWNNSEQFRGTLLGIWEMMKEFGSDSWAIFSNLWESAKFYFGKVVSFVKSSIDTVMSTVNKVKSAFGMDGTGKKAAAPTKRTKVEPKGEESAYERGMRLAKNGNTKIDLFGGLTRSFKTPSMDDIGNDFGATGDTSSNIDFDLGGGAGAGAGAGGSGGGSGKGGGSVKSFKSEKSTTGGLVINVENLFNITTQRLLDKAGADGMALRDELVRQFTAIVKDVEVSYGA